MPRWQCWRLFNPSWGVNKPGEHHGSMVTGLVRAATLLGQSLDPSWHDGPRATQLVWVTGFGPPWHVINSIPLTGFGATWMSTVATQKG